MGWLELLPLHVPALLLHVTRAASFFWLAPLFGGTVESKTYRLVLGLTFGVVFWWASPGLAEPPRSLAGLGGLVAIEVVVGLAAAYALRAITTLVAVAGEVIGQEMGFSLSRVLDPVSGVATTPIARLFEALAFLLVLRFDLHHDFLRALAATWDFVPIGQGFAIDTVHARLESLVDGAIRAGVQLAMPVLAVMLLLTVVLVVLARAVPNINLLEFSFGLRVLLALGALVLFADEAIVFLGEAIGLVVRQATVLFAGA